MEHRKKTFHIHAFDVSFTLSDSQSRWHPSEESPRNKIERDVMNCISQPLSSFGVSTWVDSFQISTEEPVLTKILFA